MKKLFSIFKTISLLIALILLISSKTEEATFMITCAIFCSIEENFI